MANDVNNIPESWLFLLGGNDVSGWLSAFTENPKKSVNDLIWDAFYFGQLNLVERGQLLAGWLDRIGNDEQFAKRLDAEFTDWVLENWGRFDHPAKSLISAWSCLFRVVEYSAKLLEDSQLINCATVLRARFAERQQFLGSFSIAPAADPLGLYLAVIAEFQGDDRSLVAFWHNMCNLPDGVPFYHARYALLGLRRLKALDSSEDGTLRAEVVLGLLRLARAFDRLVRERGLPENIAKSTFRRVAGQTVIAYPNSPNWRKHGLTEALSLSEQVQRWVSEAVPPLAEAVKREKNKKIQHSSRHRKTIERDHSWSQRSQELAKQIKSGDEKCLPDVKRLLDEERYYAQATGDTYDIVRSLCNLASRVLSFEPQLALHWAEEALNWEPYNHYTWNTVRTILLRQGRASEALRFAWVAWKRFPEIVVTRNALADSLKAVRRYDEAEAIYRQTIERFPEDVIARNGLAGLLNVVRRYDEAEAIYRQTIEQFPEDVIARNGLAYTFRRSRRFDKSEEELLRSIKLGYVNAATFVGLAHLVLPKGEVGRAEALNLIDQALRLDPYDPYAKSLKQQLMSESEINFDNLAREWEKASDAIFNIPQLTKSEYEWVSEEETAQFKATDELPVMTVDLFTVAALVAEAYFYRTWSKDADEETAITRRRKAAELLAQAEQLSPQYAPILAEKAILSVDEGKELVASERLMTQLRTHPAAAPLLVIKARLDRELARKQKRQLNEETLNQLCFFPQRLRDLNPTFMTLFHFQKGLAALSLLDGEKRKEIAADEFTRFRKTLAYRADEERKKRESSYQKGDSNFHEWLKGQVDRRVFEGLTDSENTKVDPADINLLDMTWEKRRPAIEEVEDVFSDRLAFGII